MTSTSTSSRFAPRTFVKSIIPENARRTIRRLMRRRRHAYAVPPSELKESFGRASYTYLFAQSMFDSLKNRHAFSDVRTFCMFLGYPRSGHSLLGALLDAHPQMIIAHEVDVLGLIEMGRLSRRQIFSLLLKNSRMFASDGRKWSGYSYAVPGQWQGKFSTLRVIGDKKAGASTVRLRRRPDLLQKLEKKVAIEARYIHHIRNPYDCISTICRVRKESAVSQQSIDWFFGMCDTMTDLKRRVPSSRILDGRHEDMVAEPRNYLRRACEFLGLESDEDYLDSCAGIMFKSPHQSRQQIEWPQEMIDGVAERIAAYDFLDGYSYQDDPEER